MSSITLLTLTSFIISLIVFLVYKIIQKDKNVIGYKIPLQETNSTNVFDILHGTDQIAVKELIINKTAGHGQLKQALLIINTDCSGNQEVVLRRKVNKFFMECLVDVQLSSNAAFIWLKKYMQPEICKTIISDMKHTG